VRKVSAIVLSPCESKAIGPVIREANEANIPVLTVDIPYRGGDAKIVTQVASLLGITTGVWAGRGVARSTWCGVDRRILSASKGSGQSEPA